MRKIIHVLTLLCFIMAHSLHVCQGQAIARADKLSQLRNSKSEPEHRSLSEALKNLRKEYKVNILFESRIIDNYRVPVSLLGYEGSIEQALFNLLNPFNLSYKRMKVGSYIILTNPKSEINVPRASTAANTNQEGGGESKKTLTDLKEIAIQGTVKDATNGQTLPGVNVTLKGTQRGTTTDVLGRYKIDVPNESAVLVFSFIGFETREVLVGTQSEVNVVLSSSTQVLNEVVVVGYGKQKRANLTGSVATIENKELKQSPVANLSNAVVGRVPGLIVKQPSGEPGNDGSTLLIRGISTSGDNTPLYVIDGIPRQPSDFAQLDANEIESFTILKDAASSAVFGVRGANGVILVTTKRGKTGKTGISYTASYGIQQPTRLPNFLDSYDYATLYNEALRNSDKPEIYSVTDLQKFKDGSDPVNYPSTDWFKEVLKPSAAQTQHNLNVNGGGEKSRYFISLGSLNQKGLYETVGFKRYNLRTNIDANVTNTTTLSLDISGRMENRKAPGASVNDIFYSMVRVPPVYPARYPNGLLAKGSGDNALGQATESGYRNDDRTILLSRLSLTQQLPFVPGLALTGIVALDKGYTINKNWTLSPQLYQLNTTNSTFDPLGTAAPTLMQRSYNYQSVTAETHLTYGNTFGKHEINGLFLYTQNVTTDNTFSAFRINFPSTAIDQISAGDAGNQQTTGTSSKSTRKGYVGRINYAFNERYLLEANFRYDGSDNFASGQKFGFFPSVSVGWLLSSEAFVRDNLSFIDFAKIRASYGKLGNDRLRDANGNDIRRYPFLATYNYGNDYVFGGNSPSVVKGLTENGLATPNTTWETATKTDIGLEMRLLRGLISFEADYFYQRRSGILGQRNIAIPALLGANLPIENIGIIDNRGIELSLGHQKKVGSNLTYFVRSNITFVKNKIIFVDEPISTNPLRQVTGRPLNQFVGLEALGLFENAEEIKNSPVQFGNTNLQPGDIRYRDMNGDGKIDNEDRTSIGRSNIPQIIYGISTGITWRGFDISVMFQGAGQVDQYLSEEAAWAFFNGGKVQDIHLERWTPSNPNANYPRILLEDTNNRIISSYWLKNAAYLRLKNVEIAYSLPKAIATKIRAESIRLFINGMNLLTISEIKNFDPENTNSRAWAYPQQKVFNTGINIQF